MTNKEAIAHLKNINDRYPCSLDTTFQDECEMITINLAIKALEERPQGEWLHNSDRPDNLICSACNCGWDMWRYESRELKYCPNCGADMRKGDNNV